MEHPLFFQMRNVVQVLFHNRAVGIRLMTSIWLSTAISFFTSKGMLDDII